MTPSAHGVFPTHDINPRPPEGLHGQFAVERIQPSREGDDIPHRHNFTEFMYVTGGSGSHVIDFTSYQIDPPQVYLLAQGQVHHWESVKDLEGMLVVFKDEFMTWNPDVPRAILDLPAFGAPALKPDPAQACRVERLIDAAVDEYAVPSPTQSLSLRAMLTILLIECSRMTPETSHLTRSRFVDGFIRMVVSRISAQTTVAECAAELGVTAGHLNAVVLDEIGRTPGEFIRRTLLREAERLLVGSDLTGAQIAEHLGFSSASYFSRFFQREHGLTPSRYRAARRPA